MNNANEDAEHGEKMMKQRAEADQQIRPFNMHVTYHFKDHAFDPVSIDTPLIPNVGERVAFSALEMRHHDRLPNREYGNRDRYWRVTERIFILTVPTTVWSSLMIGTQQRVEIYIEPYGD